MKQSPENYLYLKGDITRNSSKKKMKATKGLGKAFMRYYERLKNKDIQGFMNDIIEFHDQKFWKPEKEEKENNK